MLIYWITGAILLVAAILAAFIWRRKRLKEKDAHFYKVYPELADIDKEELQDGKTDEEEPSLDEPKGFKRQEERNSFRHDLDDLLQGHADMGSYGTGDAGFEAPLFADTDEEEFKRISQELAAEEATRNMPESREDAREQQRDILNASAFAPSEVLEGDEMLVMVYAHLWKHTGAVEAMAEAMDEELQKKAQTSLNIPVERGSVVSFTLSAPGAEVEEPYQSITWWGEPAAMEFFVQIPEGPEKKYLRCTITVNYGDIPLGRLRFRVKLLADAREVEQGDAFTPVEGKRYRQAFISYASQDRAEVLKRTQMLEKSGIRFFQDVLNLQAGQRWEKQLYKHIASCDVFYLFWSEAAKSSAWVDRETRYALEKSRQNPGHLPDIIPVPIEGPPIPVPPAYLKGIHFADRFMYMLKPDAGN